MAKKTVLAAGTSPFAHLLGGAAALAGRALGKKAEDDTPIEDEGPTDEDQVVDDLKDVEEPGDEGKKGKKAKGRKAAADDDDDQDSEADAEDKSGDDDDDETETDKEKAAYQRGLAMGRVRENKRCSRIFLAPAAAGRPDLAATLAFTTRNSSAEAGRLLTVVGAAAPSRGRGLDDRMAGRNDPRPGADGGRQGKPSFSDRIAAARKKAGIS